MNLQCYTDNQLLSLLKENSEVAFDELYKRYYKLIFLSVYRQLGCNQDAEDIIQDIFTSVWLRRHKVETENIKSYLLGAADKKVIDIIRKKTCRRRNYQEYNTIATTSFFQRVLENKELGLKIGSVINDIIPSWQYPFIHHYIHRRSIATIAARMKVKPQSVKNGISQALKILRENLKDSFPLT